MYMLFLIVFGNQLLKQVDMVHGSNLLPLTTDKQVIKLPESIKYEKFQIT